MAVELPDWGRLQKALSIEATRGFVNLMGKEYRFSEFLHASLSEPPQDKLMGAEIRRWQGLAAQFGRYGELSRESREQLVEETRKFLLDMERICTRSPSAAVTSPGPRGAPAPAASRSVAPRRAPRGAIAPDRGLTQVPGIGAKTGDRLAKLGLYTVADLLYYYPRDHIDYARQVNIAELEPGETVTAIGTVKRCNCFSSPRNSKLTIFELVLKDATGQIKISRFFPGYRSRSRGWQEMQKRAFPLGAVVAASGRVKKNKYGITLDNPQLEVLDGEGGAIESLNVGRVVPVYPLTEGVGADVVRKAVNAVLPAIAHLNDPLPGGLRKKYGLMELGEAIANIHFPRDRDILDAARQRLVFDEFFYLQLGLLHRRQSAKTNQKSVVLPRQGQLIEKFYSLLPFRLTGAQERVIGEILNDLEKPEPMNRLVQGDVGSGKTVVAVVAILAAIQAGYQAALMAPTEVLAEQHYQKLVNWLNLLHLPVELLTGSTKTSKRRQIHAQLETGELPVLVGTHALIQEKVTFHRLGLIAIDEQHRFGVGQRAKLRQKGVDGVPHVLSMTATPIPRTLALTLHGDLDVSQIDELPPGRQAIQTTVLGSKDRPDAYELIRRELAQGRQAYVVLPLVEESEKLDLKSAIEEYERLQESVFPYFQVGLLHGRLTSAQKEEAIGLFREGRTQILVSTTVVEVGVDVPNATVMLIENAERFGLSQLHQLRGRVGRGADRSYCLLMTHPKATAEARQRLNVMAQSQDGFLIAEMDMQLRGPGEVLGTRQSGLPDFALASLTQDQEVLVLARDAAGRAIAKDPTLERWPLLKVKLEQTLKRLMEGAILT